MKKPMTLKANKNKITFGFDNNWKEFDKTFQNEDFKRVILLMEKNLPVKIADCEDIKQFISKNYIPKKIFRKEKELKGFEMTIEDGHLKGCLVYHEGIIDFIKENFIPKKELIKELEKIKKPSLKKCLQAIKMANDNNTFMNGYNQALQEVINKLKL